MGDDAELSYTAEELHGYLPSGWRLADPDGGVWDARKARWTTAVADGAEMEWTLRVDGAEAGKHGRLEALRRAVDRVYREALG